jgi:hypothetical protein
MDAFLAVISVCSVQAVWKGFLCKDASWKNVVWAKIWGLFFKTKSRAALKKEEEEEEEEGVLVSQISKPLPCRCVCVCNK